MGFPCLPCLQELVATQKSLRDALQRVALLEEQVAIVDELKNKMIEQDDLILRLRVVIDSDVTKQVSSAATAACVCRGAGSEGCRHPMGGQGGGTAFVDITFA